MRPGLALVLPVLLHAASASLPAAQWTVSRSRHFEVFTDCGPETGRRTAERLEQIHGFLGAGIAAGTRAQTPARVFLFQSEAEFRQYRPSDTAIGFFHPAPERNCIVLREAGSDTWRVAFHEYVHAALRSAGPRLPLWFEEGTAEFFSTLEAGPGRLVVGHPVPEHLAALTRSRWYTAEALSAFDRNSPAFRDHKQTGIFYAQSWALVHMLNLSPGYRDGMPLFAALLSEGTAPASAFPKAFGKTLTEALKDLARYVAAGRLPSTEIDQPLSEPSPVGESMPMPEPAVSLAKAELLVDLGKREVAGELYRRIAREYAPAPEIETGLGILALARRDHKEARRRLERAIELGSREARTYFEYAMLLRDAGEGRERAVGQLRNAVSLNPGFAEARFLLGTLLSEEGNLHEAAEHLALAASNQPRRTDYWHALALAQQRLGRSDAARRAAQNALEAAVTEQETAMALAALRLAERPPQPMSGERPPVHTPESWEPKRGDSLVKGVLERIDCFGRSARFHIRTGTGSIDLFVADPGAIRIEGTLPGTYEFRCGMQKPASVSVEYVARLDSKNNTAGDIVSIKFK